MPSTWPSVCVDVSRHFVGGGMRRTDVGDGAVEGGFGAGVFGAEEAVHDGGNNMFGVLSVLRLLLLGHRAQDEFELTCVCLPSRLT